MKITEVRVRKVNGGGKLKAFASITIDGLFVVHDLKVIEGHKGFFVAMPSRRTSNGEFKDIAHPIATEAREMIQRRIIEAYWELDGTGAENEASRTETADVRGGTPLREERGEPGSEAVAAATPPGDATALGEGTPLREVGQSEELSSDGLSRDL